MAKKIGINKIPEKYKRQTQKRERRVIRCSLLIVCEGTKTEPNYFKAFSNKQIGLFVYDIEIKGLGQSTQNVVEKAIELKKKNTYDRVWAVFDKDDFPASDFNAAITMGGNNDVKVAWSNEAFELWYLYHFHNVTVGMPRTDYEEKISEAVNASPRYISKKKKYKYAKNATDNFIIMTTYGSVDRAIQFAEARHCQCASFNYADHNPCTTVYKLVRQLLGKDEELNNELIEKAEE